MFQNVAQIVIACVVVVGVVIGPISYLIGIHRGERMAKRRYAHVSKRIRSRMESEGHI